ncbi:hypothetical protein CHS0354_008879, partial [Potamilus streckersoni]
MEDLRLEALDLQIWSLVQASVSGVYISEENNTAAYSVHNTPIFRSKIDIVFLVNSHSDV